MTIPVPEAILYCLLRSDNLCPLPECGERACFVLRSAFFGGMSGANGTVWF